MQRAAVWGALVLVAETHALRAGAAAPVPCTARRGGASPQLLLDTLTAGADEADFKRNPAEFCSSRVQQQGLAFNTAAFGGAVFAGDDTALDVALGEGAELDEPQALLGAPFPGASEPYEAVSDAFNSECYQELFLWIPKYKETGGFSTFRFDDFLDARVRSVRPSGPGCY